MKNVQTRHAVVAFIGLVAVVAAPVHAQLKIKGNDAYWSCPNGHVVTDGIGGCVRTIAWTQALAIPECEGKAAVKTAEAPKPAPAAAPVPTPAPVVAAEKITLKAGALFDVGKSDLKPAGKGELDELATRLKGMTNVEAIGVTGHTDNQGDASFNQRLSDQRAVEVKSYLVSKGVDGSKITTSGKGSSQPTASNATAEGRALNRRVELDIKASK